MNIMDKEGDYYQLAPDLTICRIVNGMWQVAGGHGYIDHKLAIEDMIRYHDAGFTSWDVKLMATGHFKMLVSGDNIRAQNKFKDSFDFNNYAKLIFSANEIPESEDQRMHITADG